MAVALTPPDDAVITDVVVSTAPFVVRVNVAVVVPAGTRTNAGT